MPKHPPLSLEREIEKFGRTEGFGAAACRPSIAERPVGHRQLLHVEVHVLAGGHHFQPLSLRKEYRHTGMQALLDVPDNGIHDRLPYRRRRPGRGSGSRGWPSATSRSRSVSARSRASETRC